MTNAVAQPTAETEDCRACRVAADLLRTLAFMVVGVLIALLIVAILPESALVATLFAVIVIAAVLYSIIRIMHRPSPAAALARLSLTLGIGVVFALLLGLVLG